MEAPTPAMSIPRHTGTPLVDIGINLGNKQYNNDRVAVVDRALSHGVGTMIITGCSEMGSVEAQKLAAKRPGVLYSTAGVHPHDARFWTENTAATMRNLAKKPEVVSLGECGLDYDRMFSPKDVQIQVFKAQLDLARTLEMPLFLHERSAFEDFVKIMEEYRDVIPKVFHSRFATKNKACVHCFTGSGKELDKYLEMGFYIGITGWVCDLRRGSELRNIVSRIPTDKIMIETDGPFLTPRTGTPPGFNIRRNEPAFLPMVLNELAKCMSLTPTELADYSTANALKFFGIPSDQTQTQPQAPTDTKKEPISFPDAFPPLGGAPTQHNSLRGGRGHFDRDRTENAGTGGGRGRGGDSGGRGGSLVRRGGSPSRGGKASCGKGGN